MAVKSVWQVGARFPAFEIIEVISGRLANRDSAFRIRTTCCGSERVVARSTLKANSKRDKCALCRKADAEALAAKAARTKTSAASIKPVSNPRRTFEKGFRSHPGPDQGITYLRPEGESHLVERNCCGRTEIMRHHILLGYLKRVGTGSGVCRACMSVAQRGRRRLSKDGEGDMVSANVDAVLSDLEQVVLTHQWIDPKWHRPGQFGWDHRLGPQSW